MVGGSASALPHVVEKRPRAGSARTKAPSLTSKRYRVERPITRFDQRILTYQPESF
jgi:hypothetical protein